MTNSVPVTYWFCDEFRAVEGSVTYSDESEDTLSVIHSSSSSTEGDTPVTPEVFFGRCLIKDRHSLMCQHTFEIKGMDLRRGSSPDKRS